ncbi:MAG: hypothetical protein FE78DRAFT_69048 [Acidomyces sp. 'richmondensis']|nr:MAG: hypothetical protein FE78DRAFT_69048 [Acidomyces sp. 'richmondensis']
MRAGFGSETVSRVAAASPRIGHSHWPSLRSGSPHPSGGIFFRTPPPPARPPPFTVVYRAPKQLSPGPSQRVHGLDGLRRATEVEGRQPARVGRIAEQQLADLEQLRGRRAAPVAREETPWVRLPVQASIMAALGGSGGVRLDGGPVLSEAETLQLESDVSSTISIGDRLVATDSEDDGHGLIDKLKYRMPDIGKTRLHLRTKEPLSPTPRQATQSLRSPHSQAPQPTPATPRAGNGSGLVQVQSGAEQPMAHSNPSVESFSDGDFVNAGLSRAGSIYSLSRVSFSGQLAQLTTMRLPDANSMAKRISSIPTSKEAAKELSDASEQIRMWVSQAWKVLGGLNAEDDIEWAVAGGRDGIEDVDMAINRFDRLVQVYVLSIERLQTRKDVSNLSADELVSCVQRMESIISSWEKTKESLKNVKEQVEIAMEWEELWNSVLGEIGQEMESLNQLVFKMEEKRHEGAEGLFSNKDSIDISELETIVEERPGKSSMLNPNRLSLQPLSSPLNGQSAQDNKDESTLLALFARMQPLRASLDFLPMRLSVFNARARGIFPTACQDLEQRREQLEMQWKKLEDDAESLRRELGEDKWVLVFRNAGRQALKMCESISRSYLKLKEAADSDEHQANPPAFVNKVESYEAKKTHYGPAIERVLAIIDRGVLDRLTVNGEILRLQSDMKLRWSALQSDMRDLDARLEELGNEGREKQLRDSVSTVMSSERSIASSLVETPCSSPASSAGCTSRKNSIHGSRTPTPLMHARSRQTTYGKRSMSNSRLRSSSGIPRRAPLTGHDESSPSPSPAASRISLKPETPVGNKPRWVSTGKSECRDFLPLSALEPSPYAKQPITPKTNFLRASSKSATAPAKTSGGRSVSTPVSKAGLAAQNLTRKSSLPMPTIAKTPTSVSTRSPLAPKTSSPALRTSSSLRVTVGASARRSSMLPTARPSLVPDGNEADSESPTHHKSRPPSALASGSLRGRRSSMLPLRSRSRMEDPAAAGHSQEAHDRPRWRP